MTGSIRFAALAVPLLAGVALFAGSPAYAQQTPAPADAPVLEPGLSTVATVAETPDSGTMKRADKDMLAVLKKLGELGAKPIESRSVAEARAQPTPADAVKAVLKDQGKDAMALMAAMKVSKKDMTYPTAGGTQPIRIYTPEGAGSGPLPVIVYYHGGGWVIADLDTYEASAMALAKKSGAIVASVEYRHAPENKFPAAHEDSFAAYKWVLANAGQFGGDPARLAVAGESAGGNLATNVAIMARDGNVQLPVHMLIVYPVAGTDMTTPSYIANQNAMPLSKSAMGWFVDKVLAKQEDAKSPMLNLTTLADLKGLPPATVITDSIDPLMSEGKMLAEKLKAAGVSTTYKNYEGVTHEFFGMGAVVSDAEAAEDMAGHELKEAFAKTPTK
ncbi:alpha/beta hydrolase [Lichenihabitans sp. Uapishka_5]|uniref:alpha/beta hydrolase n=1 Tax=Lichenihabitans sp. Uapishka_5 TaxID=3037302 RepID=UPI0029E7ED18|nr:alpha/beta hydrolase [Lichenihabitans sp. Uapishka_5]MDX7953794.1 alpha/beta hydrolase [Lichenihabitans sp. Uapishka_5]